VTTLDANFTTLNCVKFYYVELLKSPYKQIEKAFEVKVCTA